MPDHPGSPEMPAAQTCRADETLGRRVAPMGGPGQAAAEDELISLEYRAENGAARLNNFMGHLLLEDSGWTIYWRAATGLIVYYDKVNKTIHNLEDLDGLSAHVDTDTCKRVQSLLPVARDRYDENI
jgi:hypothetical protein